jgi:hypothetical protein
VRCPVYFFVGRHDYNSPWQLTEAYYQALNAPAGKRLVWFENSAHDLFFDEPRRLEQEVLSICRRAANLERLEPKALPGCWNTLSPQSNKRALKIVNWM